MKEDLEKLLETAATTVFSTMLNSPVEFAPSDSSFFNGGTHLAGAVGLTGAYNGIIYLYSSTSFARRMTCCLLSMSETEIDGDEMVNDAFGELTNMVAGVIKSKLENLNEPCIMTIPSVVRGTDFRIEAVTGVERRSVFCCCKEGRVLVEALIKPCDSK